MLIVFEVLFIYIYKFGVFLFLIKWIIIYFYCNSLLKKNNKGDLSNCNKYCNIPLYKFVYVNLKSYFQYIR